MENINFTNFITKGLETSEQDGRRIVKGHITAEIVDRQGEFIAVNEVLDIIKNYMEINPVVSDYHSNRMVGKVLSYQKSSIDGHPSVYIEAEIYKKKGVSLYDRVWDKVLKGEYRGFSMGGASKERQPIVKDGKLVMNLKNLELYEIALCPFPANPLAVIDYVNEFAKAANLTIMNNDGKNRIQCAGIQCEIEKGTNVDIDLDIDNTGKDKELKEMNKEEPKNTDNLSITNENSNIYKGESETNINNMSQNQTEIKKDETSTTQKTVDHSSEISLLSTLVKSHEDKFDSLLKAQEALTKSVTELTEKIKKAEDGNPVAHGASAELKPAVSDSKDVGQQIAETTGSAPAGGSASYAPKGDAQASIIAPASGSETVTKADEKKEEKKEEKEMAKAEKAAPDGYKYEIIKAQRPKIGLLPETPENAPTGAEILKATLSGWGGKYTNFEKSFIETYQRLIKGEFGTGLPRWV